MNFNEYQEKAKQTGIYPNCFHGRIEINYKEVETIDRCQKKLR